MLNKSTEPTYNTYYTHCCHLPYLNVIFIINFLTQYQTLLFSDESVHFFYTKHTHLCNIHLIFAQN